MSDVMNGEDSPENALLWTREQEELLKDWCDIANCFRWVHEQASFKNREINNRIALPVIVLSTLTGTANFAMKSLVAEQYQVYASAAIGGINILCGILTTIQTYFKYAENTEAHSSASKLWSKLQRVIQIELSIEPAKRKHPNEFLKYCIDEYNKLTETSPTIPPEIADEFRNKFKKVNDVFKPDIYDKLTSAQTYINYISRASSKQQIVEQKNELKNAHSNKDYSSFQKLDLAERRYSDPGKPILSILKNKGILDESGTVERVNISAKDAVKKELELIRPNIQKLIQRMETMKSPYKAEDSPINSDLSDETKDTDSKEKETGTIEINIDSVKNI
jgi:hypothetical protein